jgi:hypothetical protein
MLAQNVVKTKIKQRICWLVVTVSSSWNAFSWCLVLTINVNLKKIMIALTRGHMNERVSKWECFVSHCSDDQDPNTKILIKSVVGSFHSWFSLSFCFVFNVQCPAVDLWERSSQRITVEFFRESEREDCQMLGCYGVGTASWYCHALRMLASSSDLRCLIGFLW